MYIRMGARLNLSIVCLPSLYIRIPRQVGNSSTRPYTSSLSLLYFIHFSKMYKDTPCRRQEAILGTSFAPLDRRSEEPVKPPRLVGFDGEGIVGTVVGCVVASAVGT